MLACQPLHGSSAKLVRRNCKTSAELSQCELGGLAAPVFRFARGSNRRVNAARQLDVIFFLEELSNSILYDTPALHPPALLGVEESSSAFQYDFAFRIAAILLFIDPALKARTSM